MMQWISLKHLCFVALLKRCASPMSDHEEAIMGWWKCSSEVFWSDVAQKLSKPLGHGDATRYHRIYTLIQLLNLSADRQTIQSPAGLAARTRMTEKQCGIVWETCIGMNVLRRDGNGYSAREWMQEQGLFQDAEISQYFALNHASDIKTDNLSFNTENAKTDAPEKQKRTFKRELKEQVRPNVRLSRSEIDKLRSEFTDAEITRMVDKLSEYKTNSGRRYASDYQAIQRWVIGWIRDQKNTPQQETTQQPEPSAKPKDWADDEEFMRIMAGRK
jgi:hypothetical protein